MIKVTIGGFKFVIEDESLDGLKALLDLCNDVAISHLEKVGNDTYYYRLMTKIDYLQEEISCIEEFSDPVGDGDYWCYLYQFKNTNVVHPAFVHIALEEAMKQVCADCMIQVSVTSSEDNYKAWLQAAEGYPGATITATKRPGRTCYLLTFPATPDLSKV